MRFLKVLKEERAVISLNAINRLVFVVDNQYFLQSKDSIFSILLVLVSDFKQLKLLLQLVEDTVHEDMKKTSQPAKI